MLPAAIAGNTLPGKTTLQGAYLSLSKLKKLKLNIFPFEIYVFFYLALLLAAVPSTGYSFPVCYGRDWKLSRAN